jgi:hypothetical protein
MQFCSPDFQLSTHTPTRGYAIPARAARVFAIPCSSQDQETHVTTSCPRRSYFDLHVIGLGYLNRIREVKPKKGDPFLACEIAALTGPSEAPEYRRFDVRVTDSSAQSLIRSLAEPVSDRRKVLIGFRLRELWTDLFRYTKGKNAGRPGVSLKASLVFVAWIKIDGALVYEADRRFKDDPKHRAI